MAILDQLRARMNRRKMRPEEEQGWGRQPEGGTPWNQTLRNDVDIEMLSRPRTVEEEEAYRLGEQMAAEGMVSLSGKTPFRRRDDDQGGRLMNAQRLNKATETLMKYKDGKASVNKRVVKAQEWWKLKNWDEIRKDRGVKGSTAHPSDTGWLWNCIIGKHADAIDSYPEPVILPREETDKEEAKKLSSILPVVLEINEFEQTYNDVMWQKLQEGTGVYGIFWNKNKLNGLGDIDIKKVNILNLYWEPGISDIQESRNVFYVSFEDKDDVYSMYPEIKDKLNTNKLSIDKYKTDDNVDLSNKVPVIDWYYKKMLDGQTVLHMCKYVGEYCLYSSEETDPNVGFYADGGYPFVLDPLYPVEGSPAGYGMIDIGKDIQTDIDVLNQAMVKNATMRATPRYFARKDGGVNEEEFMDWSKPIVHVNNMLGQDYIRAIEVAAMGNDAHNMLQQKIDELKFITGNTDVNNGGVPAGVTAASAIAALKEDSGRSSKDSTKAGYRATRKVYLMSIERIRQFYDIPRQFRIIGQENNQVTFESYSNVNLQVQTLETLPGEVPGMRLPVFDVEVRAQRENAYTKMSQNELALQFWGNGMLNPQMTDQALIVLDMMDFRGKDTLRNKIQQQGTMQDTLLKVAQIAMALAEKYDPAVTEQLGMVLTGMAADAGVAPAGGEQKNGVVGNLRTPGSEMEAPRQANENAIVRNARERAANASRPS